MCKNIYIFKSVPPSYYTNEQLGYLPKNLQIFAQKSSHMCLLIKAKIHIFSLQIFSWKIVKKKILVLGNHINNGFTAECQISKAQE